jgi:hypothetical protein
MGAPVHFIDQFRQLCRFLEISTLADAGCGDLEWMEGISRHFTLYIGLDRQEIVTARNDRLYGRRQGHFFACRDVARDPLPAVDAILCRDLFAENDPAAVSEILANVKASGARYLLASTTPGADSPLDLTAAPFNLPLPLMQFIDEPASGKLLGAWLIPRRDP